MKRVRRRTITSFLFHGQIFTSYRRGRRHCSAGKRCCGWVLLWYLLCRVREQKLHSRLVDRAVWGPLPSNVSHPRSRTAASFRLVWCGECVRNCCASKGPWRGNSGVLQKLLVSVAVCTLAKRWGGCVLDRDCPGYFQAQTVSKWRRLLSCVAAWAGCWHWHGVEAFIWHGREAPCLPPSNCSEWWGVPAWLATTPRACWDRGWEGEASSFHPDALFRCSHH